MTTPTPTHERNLDTQYGGGPLTWETVSQAVAEDVQKMETAVFLGTVRPDGRPHSAAIGAFWTDGEIFVVSGPGTRKSRNLAANPHCTLSVRTSVGDVIFEGTAARVTDAPTLERVAAGARDGGWPAQVEGEAVTAPYSAQSAGPPPWWVYRITYDTVFGVATSEPFGATRWSFTAT
ncbi:pyridoxamine 5'-phosphate oxidase family protein [Ornithinimicrobium sp. F0845]|uniref:pyridoxamine 5'-phosphate oxidase family protein n=1 Tax=Ornithinimicrobium sp. F0845 TaxID=2926412 RepID=UPI001FF6C868|nr:pyridoxamine 5'-phosphate oxidase family protein [Ornithinimicrobium sp. F0845]MCK0111999.1 pyridoxamine 5'-phosphate oxidase family protein [Ornithinimicrobium sp. F0845]